ncbi:MAG: hypothetical protein OEU32_14000 [Acidimicrobiia bacterium]|nr:hypothetical protein [Acidimicrobiia bacterium]
MTRILIAIALVVGSVALAAIIQRRRPDAPTQGRGHVPDQLDRADFDRPDAPLAVIVFTSATCATCSAVWRRALALVDSRIVAQEVEAGADAALHERYEIDAVPLAVVADASGVVRASFLGPISDHELEAVVSRLAGS